jgi:adenine-specific DNA-methyltransferase
LRRYNQQDERGKFFWDTYSRSGLASEDPDSDSLYYEVEFPDGSKRAERWRRSKERLAVDVKEGEAKFVTTGSGWTIHFKQRLNEEGKRPRQILFDSMGNTEGGADLEKVWPELNFPYPKPCTLISFLAEISGTEGGIIMDFFAGSGTTAQAVLELNRQNYRNRKFILVQLPEPTERKDFPTIADITKERVRRVIKKLSIAETQKRKQEKSELKLGDAAPARKLDLGFKVFKLSSSNFKVWDATSAPKDAAGLAEQLKLMSQNVVENRGDEALLYEIILKSNLPLTGKIQSGKIGAQTFYDVADGTLAICLERKLTLETLRGIIARKPRSVICLDIAFAGNDQLKTNIVLEMKSHGIEFHTA